MSILPITDHTKNCAVCGKEDDIKRCGRCQKVFYCSIEHQREDWSTHKLSCRSVIEITTTATEKAWVAKELALLRPLLGDRYARIKELYNVKRAAEVSIEYLQTFKEGDERDLMLIIFGIGGHPSLTEAFQYYHKKMPGARKIEGCLDSLSETDDCSKFAFLGTSWYPEKADTAFIKSLFTFFPEVLSFLQGQGYRVTAEPTKGDIVMYCTHVYREGSWAFPDFHEMPRVAHYGKVESVEDGRVIVRSRLGDDIYEHRLELIPYFLGNRYVILSNS